MSSFLASAKYGKDKVRVFRVVRTTGLRHDIVEYNICALLEGDIDVAWTQSDNTVIVATDSIKNTIYLKAKTSPHVVQPEKFALELGTHFVDTYKHIHKAHIDIVQYRWTRIMVEGQAHPHSFLRDGDEKRFTSVSVDASLGKDKITATVTSGLKDLLVLKTTESSFENFVTDEFRTLPDTSDRIFSTSVDCAYQFILPVIPSLTIPSLTTLNIDFDLIFEAARTTTLKVFATHNSASVQATLYIMAQDIIRENADVAQVTYSLPNKHYFAVDMTYHNIKNTLPADAEVFMPVDSPSGLIVATVRRS